MEMRYYSTNGRVIEYEEIKDYDLLNRNGELLNFMDFMIENQYNRVAVNTDNPNETHILDDIHKFFDVYGVDVGRLEKDFISCVYIDYGIEDKSRINVIFKVGDGNKRFTMEVIEEC